jgi:hypothetical protein
MTEANTPRKNNLRDARLQVYDEAMEHAGFLLKIEWASSGRVGLGTSARVKDGARIRLALAAVAILQTDDIVDLGGRGLDHY